LFSPIIAASLLNSALEVFSLIYIGGALSSSAPALRSHPIVQTYLILSHWGRWHDLFSADYRPAGVVGFAFALFG